MLFFYLLSRISLSAFSVLSTATGVKGNIVRRKAQTLLVSAPGVEQTETQGKWTLNNKETYWLMKVKNPASGIVVSRYSALTPCRSHPRPVLPSQGPRQPPVAPHLHPLSRRREHFLPDSSSNGSEEGPGRSPEPITPCAW